MSNSSVAQWTLEAQNGIESLKFSRVPINTLLGQHEVLVELRAASLNYRDIVIAKVSYCPCPEISYIQEHSDSQVSVSLIINSNDPGHAWPRHYSEYRARIRWRWYC